MKPKQRTDALVWQPEVGKVLNWLEGMKKEENPNLFAGTETIQGAYRTGKDEGYNQAIQDIINKLEEEK